MRDYYKFLANFHDNNLKNLVYGNFNKYKAKSNESIIVGIDEAGRGPVLGPLVYGLVSSTTSSLDKLLKLGFCDSKKINENQREKLFVELNSSKEINTTTFWSVNILSPNFISNLMLKKEKYNLNYLSHDAVITLITKFLQKGNCIHELYIDTIGPPEKMQSKLRNIFSKQKVHKIVVSKKADDIYSIVGCASICAKVIRDRIIKCWKFKECLPNINLTCQSYRIPLDFESSDYGSGYPSDPKTKKFLKESFDNVFGFTSFVRFGWSTAIHIINEKACLVKWEDDLDDNQKNSLDSKHGTKMKKLKIATKNNHSITNFFQITQGKSNIIRNPNDIVSKMFPNLTFFTDPC